MKNKKRVSLAKIIKATKILSAKNQKKDYIAKVEIYGLDKMSNFDVRFLMKWLKEITESKIKPDRISADKIITYKLMK